MSGLERAVRQGNGRQMKRPLHFGKTGQARFPKMDARCLTGARCLTPRASSVVWQRQSPGHLKPKSLRLILHMGSPFSQNTMPSMLCDLR